MSDAGSLVRMGTQVQLSLKATTPGFDPAERLVILDCDGQVTKIGRASKTLCKGLLEAKDNFWITSPVMSRTHAEVWYDREHATAMIRDASSMHGTRLNGLKLRAGEGVPLTDGDTLEFGLEIRRGSEVFPAYQFVVGSQVLVLNDGERDPPNTIKFPDLSDVDDENYGSEDLVDDLQSLDGGSSNLGRASSDLGRASPINRPRNHSREYGDHALEFPVQESMWKDDFSSTERRNGSRASRAFMMSHVVNSEQKTDAECVEKRFVEASSDQLSSTENPTLSKPGPYSLKDNESKIEGSMLSSQHGVTVSREEPGHDAQSESRRPKRMLLSRTENHSWQPDVRQYSRLDQDKPTTVHTPATTLGVFEIGQPAPPQHGYEDHEAINAVELHNFTPQSSPADHGIPRQIPLIKDSEAVIAIQQEPLVESSAVPGYTKWQPEDYRRASSIPPYRPFLEHTMGSTLPSIGARFLGQYVASSPQPVTAGMKRKSQIPHQRMPVSETACFSSSRSRSCSNGAGEAESAVTSRREDTVSYNADVCIRKCKAQELSTTAGPEDVLERSSSLKRSFDDSEHHDDTPLPRHSTNLGDSRPNHKMRRLAEAAGCAVVGGLVAGIGIVSMLVASAPDFE